MNKLLKMLWQAPLRTIIIVAVVLTAAGSLKWHASLMPINPVVPAPVMPSPNAWNYFKEAEACYKNDGLNKLPDDIKGCPLAEKEAFVRLNLPVIQKVGQGLQYPYCPPPARSFTYLYDYLPQDRTLARVLRLAGECRAAHDDMTGAMHYYLDGIQLGADLPKHGTILPLLVGIACESMETNAADKVIDRLNILQSLDAIRRLDTIDIARVQPYQTLQEEKWSEQGGLLEVFRTKSWHQSWSDISGEAPTNDDRMFVESFEIHTESPRSIYDHYSDYMDRMIAASKLPWPSQLHQAPIPIPKDPFSQILLPVFSGAIFVSDRNLVDTRLLEIRLALHSYKLQHATYPNSLRQVVPAYLPRELIDPFSDGQPFKYVNKGSSYLLYSIGPDAIDNGGKPIYDASMKSHPYSVSAQSETGDFVAGVNY